jgi:nucleotide-binding universal stress UspA family protein
MRGVLAAIEPDACAQPVVGTAIALADLFDATPVALYVRENGTTSPLVAAEAAGVELRETAGQATEQIVRAAHDPEVAALELGARGMHGGPQPAGHTAFEVITRVAKPVAVVPPQARTPERITQILIPLEGTVESSNALEQTVKLAHAHQLEILVLHVHSPVTVPAFSDHEPHGTPGMGAGVPRPFTSRPRTSASSSSGASG